MRSCEIDPVGNSGRRAGQHVMKQNNTQQRKLEKMEVLLGDVTENRFVWLRIHVNGVLTNMFGNKGMSTLKPWFAPYNAMFPVILHQLLSS